MEKCGFGTSQRRFSGKGLHPGFETRGANYQNTLLGPGTYFQVDIPKKPKGVSWKKSLEVSEFSKNLGYKGEHILQRRLEEQRNNGPAWYEVSEIEGVGGISFTKASRNDKRFLSKTPGPGSHGKNHIPSLRYEEKLRAKFSTVPTFEYDQVARGTVGKHVPYHLPSNIYKLKDSFTDKLISRVTSVRGPYDLFTGPRDDSTLYSYQKNMRRCVGQDRLIDHKTSYDILYGGQNTFKGVWLKTGREADPTIRAMLTDPSACKKDPNSPAPNQYDPIIRKPVKQNIWAFNTSLIHVRPVIKYEFKPDPTRYFQKHVKHRQIIGNGMKSCFISKTKRVPYLITEKYGWFE